MFCNLYFIIIFCNMGQSIQKWTKKHFWKTAFKSFTWSILEQFVPYLSQNWGVRNVITNICVVVTILRLRKIRTGWNWKRVGRCRAICCRTVFPSSMKAFFLLFYPTFTVSHAISNLLQIIVNDLCFLLSSICPPQPTVTGWKSCLNSSTQHNKTIWKPILCKFL